MEPDCQATFAGTLRLVGEGRLEVRRGGASPAHSTASAQGLSVGKASGAWDPPAHGAEAPSCSTAIPLRLCLDHPDYSVWPTSFNSSASCGHPSRSWSPGALGEGKAKNMSIMGSGQKDTAAPAHGHTFAGTGCTFPATAGPPLPSSPNTCSFRFFSSPRSLRQSGSPAKGSISPPFGKTNITEPVIDMSFWIQYLPR